MLTFDNTSSDRDPLAELRGPLPDLVEVGENNAVWFFVNRPKKLLEIRSKVDHKLTTLEMGEYFKQVAADRHGMSAKQIGAALAALALK